MTAKELEAEMQRRLAELVFSGMRHDDYLKVAVSTMFAVASEALEKLSKDNNKS